MSGAARLALFWFAGLVTLAAYYEICLGLQSTGLWPVEGDPLAPGLGALLAHVTIPILIAFLLSAGFGLWRRSDPILLRVFAALSCVAIPLAALLLCRASDPLIAEFLSS